MKILEPSDLTSSCERPKGGWEEKNKFFWDCDSLSFSSLECQETFLKHLLFITWQKEADSLRLELSFYVQHTDGSVQKQTYQKSHFKNVWRLQIN